MRSNSKSSLSRILKFVLILTLIFAMIPAVPGEAASTKSKALAAYKKKLSKSTVTVLPAGSRVWLDYDKVVNYKSSKKGNVQFSLAYIDNNNVPELILEDPNYGYGVWTYKNGKVKCVHWGDTYDAPYGYYRKKGIYEDIGYSEGTPFTKMFYKFKDGKMTLKLSKFVHCPGEPEADYFVSSGSDPYWKEVSMSAFRKKLKSYVGSTSVTKIKLRKNTSANRNKYLR